MDKKVFKLIQHSLIPFALISGNVALAHLIYLLANGADIATLTLTIIASLLLVIAIVKPSKYLLIAAIIFYSVVLGYSLMG